jgi:hypothetical protein
MHTRLSADVAAAAADPAASEVQFEIDALLARVAELRGGALTEEDIEAAGGAAAGVLASPRIFAALTARVGAWRADGAGVLQAPRRDNGTPGESDTDGTGRA